MTKELETICVADLIRKLKEFPVDMLVLIEGCDCIGYAADVQAWGPGELAAGTLPRAVIIQRTDRDL